MNRKIFRRIITIIFTITVIMASLIPFVSSFSNENLINYENQYAPLDIDWWPMFHDDSDQNGFSTSNIQRRTAIKKLLKSPILLIFLTQVFYSVFWLLTSDSSIVAPYPVRTVRTRKMKAGNPFSMRCASTGVNSDPLQRYPRPKKMPIIKRSNAFCSGKKW